MITNIIRRTYKSGNLLEFKTDKAIYIFFADIEYDMTAREIQAKFEKQNMIHIQGIIDLDQAPELVIAQFDKILMLQ